MQQSLRKILFLSVLLLGSFLLFSEAAQAQATRTWVSGVGDDANPCSRTAPCKTFAGAISKTAAGGEINCLDPGGFGAVTITKTITIDCHFTEGGVLAAGNGIIINAGANDVVVLRGLDIYGVPTPTNGVRFLAGAALHIEDSVIRRFNAANSRGVSFQPSGNSELYITNTTITENGNASTGGGILIQPTGALGVARVSLRNVRLHNNAGDAIRVDTAGNTAPDGIQLSVDNSQLAGNFNALFVNTPAATTIARVLVANSAIVNNQNRGILAGGAGTLIRVGNTTIFGNDTGLEFGTGAVVNTYGDNRLDGNAPDGTFTQPPIPKK